MIPHDRLHPHDLTPDLLTPVQYYADRSIPERLRRPEIAVDLHGRGPWSHRFLLALRPERLIAHAHPSVPESRRGATWRPHEADRSLERLADGAQGVLRDQLELARIEARDAVVSSLTGAALATLGGILFLIGWVALSMAAYTLLVTVLPPWTACVAVAAVNIALGAGVAVSGLNRIRNPRSG